MKSVEELQIAIDSLDRKLESRFTNLHKNLYRNFYHEVKKDTLTFAKKTKNKPVYKGEDGRMSSSKNDTLSKDKVSTVGKTIIKPTVTTTTKPKTSQATNKSVADLKKEKAKSETKSKAKKKNVNRLKMAQIINKDIKSYPNMAETFRIKDRAAIIAKARNASRSIHSIASSTHRTLESEKEKKVKHIYLMHTKYTYAFICLLFLFIGGPMGAIIRKGGFGMPLIISIGFFVTFIFLNILFEKLAESFVIDTILAAWMPNFILIPIAALVTYQAMSDKQILSFQWISNVFNKFRSRYKWATVLFGRSY